ncbi:hypothetical protein [Ideonella sp. YS5]|uniref:hypothetical protein n=1 Tax=Ideonella sp. YS5 TaxID=3453714 RepID=UPI003EEA81E3
MTDTLPTPSFAALAQLVDPFALDGMARDAADVAAVPSIVDVAQNGALPSVGCRSAVFRQVAGNVLALGDMTCHLLRLLVQPVQGGVQQPGRDVFGMVAHDPGLQPLSAGAAR